jgi:hypothetical protein
LSALQAKKMTKSMAKALVYYTSNDDPAASGMFVYADEN